MTNPDPVRCERRGKVAILTIDRPEKKNALSLEVVRCFHKLLVDLEADQELGGVILRGEGENFVAGADIGQLKERDVGDALGAINGGLFHRIEKLHVPVIASIDGYALGGGCELALACDLRVATERAILGQPEVGLGIIPGAGATYRLPRLVGMGRAKDLIFTGRLVPAEEAHAMGLVDRVVPAHRLEEETSALMEGILKQGSTAIRLAKLALNAQGGTSEANLAIEALAQGILFESDDKHARMGRFLERKKTRES